MSRSNRLLAQAVGQPASHDDFSDGAAFINKDPYFHDTLNFVLARLFGVEGTRLIEQHRSRVNGRRCLRTSHARSSDGKASTADAAVVTRSDTGSFSGSDSTL